MDFPKENIFWDRLVFKVGPITCIEQCGMIDTCCLPQGNVTSNLLVPLGSTRGHSTYHIIYMFLVVISLVANVLWILNGFLPGITPEGELPDLP